MLELNRRHREVCGFRITAIAKLEVGLVAELATRDAADRVSMPATRNVVDGVLGDRAEGPDGALYISRDTWRHSRVCRSRRRGPVH
jgi:hypothetical protein